MTAGTLTAEEPRATRVSRWAEAASFLSITGQLALVVLLIHNFQIESRTFYHVALAASIGFVVHALAPLRYRLPLFVLISFVAIGLGFGIGGGVRLVGAGVILIGICHLPIAFRWRLAVLAVAVAVLAAMRREVLPSSVPLGVWPVLGSMFIYRLALYLHSVKHRDAPFDVWRSLGYFFMFPNVCFPLFPAVDYQRFSRDYYGEDAFVLYQRGLRWIVRGLLQLLVYRYVYYNLAISPADVVDLGSLMQHVLATFPGLFLKITGSYHLIVGFLLLYGFNLPEVTHRFLLSSSFADFWRRMYTYWKDFMSKMVYYPLYFRLRKLGTRRALVLSLAGVFVATWLLHAWQYFWLLRQGLPFSWVDTTFWAVMGIVVTWNSLRESGKRRSAAHVGWRAGRAFAIVGTFWGIALLITFWYSSSFAEFFGLLSVGFRNASARDVLLLGGILLTGLALAGWNWDSPGATKQPRFWYRYPALQTGVTVAGLLILQQPATDGLLGTAGQVAAVSLQRSTLNRVDEDIQTRGYYDNLDNLNRFNTQLWQAEAERPDDFIDLHQTKAHRRRDDFLIHDLTPGVRVELKRRPLTVNRWGMRDAEYTLEKPEGTYRIALLGSSDVMGSGVGDEQAFEALVESRLNQEQTGGRYRRYEILNFAVAGYSFYQELEMLRTRVGQFDPDMVMVTGHGDELSFVARHFELVVKQGVPIPYPEVEEFLRVSRIDSTTDEMTITRLVLPQFDGLRSKARERMAQLITEGGAVPVFVALKLPGREIRDTSLMLGLHELGYHVLDLQGAFAGKPEVVFQVAEYDRHPNERGHKAIAALLYRQMLEHNEELALGLGATTAGRP